MGLAGKIRVEALRRGRTDSLMALPIIVLGNGGHARVLLDTLRLLDRIVIGLTTSDLDAIGANVSGFLVLGTDQLLANYSPDQVLLVNAVGSVQSMDKRKILFDTCKMRGFAFAQVIHPSAIIARDTTLGEGVQIMAGAVIQPGTHIASDSIVNTCAAIDHDCAIGKHVHIAPGCTLSGYVTVGDETHIGAGAVVIQGINVGKRCLVAAGALINRDLTDGDRVAGVPARSFAKDA